MYLLGIESATPVAGIAVMQDDRLLSERFINNRKTHSGHLLPMIKEAVMEAGIKINDIDAIAVSSGPGSFTGLRIGMSTAKSLAQVLEVPLVGISTLDALAHPLRGSVNLVCPVLNARKNEVYTAVYDLAAGSLNDLTGPKAIKPENLVHLLEQWPDRAVTFLGDGIPEYREILVEMMGNRVFFASGAVNLPRGSSVADLGRIKLHLGQSSDLYSLMPNYIRLSEAEVKWLQKQQEKEKN